MNETKLSGLDHMPNESVVVEISLLHSVTLRSPDPRPETRVLIMSQSVKSPDYVDWLKFGRSDRNLVQSKVDPGSVFLAGAMSPCLQK
jgi:hypothetical protein